MSHPGEFASDDRPWTALDRSWMVAVVFYGFGDVATTWIGIHTGGIVETGPLVAPLLEQYGPAVLLALKAGFLGGMFVLWRYVPRPHRLGVPLGLGVVGVAVTVWNTALLAVVALS
ncbi:DUF5658 family protein [Haloarcula sp. GH36]|uniref:DUF5658 family protein n=1 Tax=Haloarcula montana TaxID=3111776 RepID=UPI002D79B32A|nr:DUF5658 family protein [Haloarcula sp. GH36]